MLSAHSSLWETCFKLGESIILLQRVVYFEFTLIRFLNLNLQIEDEEKVCEKPKYVSS